MRSLRAWWCGVILAGAGVAGLAAEKDDRWVRGIYVGKSPQPVITLPAEAWQSANRLADYTDRAFVLVGSGNSMRPLYNPGTILVLRQISYAQLQRGQTVLYRNRQNRVVAHVLIARVRDGWRVQGLNNRRQDAEPLRPDNLVGVVIAAYQPTTATATPGLAGMP